MKLPTPASFSRWHWGTLAIALLVSILVFTSSMRQSVTIDEPNHFYCGLEWWQNGSYTAWPENPPLSRVIVALGPYLKGYRVESFTPDTLTMNGYFFKSYDLNYFSQAPVSDSLFWIRIFVLPLFLLSLWVVWAWAKQMGGPLAGFLAVGMYATLPSILAHSGLATTDITFLSTFILMMWRFSRWLSHPTLLNGLWLGLAAASALLAKFSVLVFFPIAALILIILFWAVGRKTKEEPLSVWLLQALKTGGVAVFIMFLTVWAFFGFSFGSLGEQPIIQAGIAEGVFPAAFNKIQVPAPEWFAGLQLLISHNTQGHPAYALGNMSFQGFWFFYPLAWLVKTPWPFMLFILAGMIGAWGKWGNNRNWESMALTVIPIAITLAVLNSHINIGLRHILVVYPLGAIGASVGLLRMVNHFSALSQGWRKLIPTGFILWQFSIAAFAFPNYLSYFNRFGGSEPGSILVDSDLDWGQGLYELSAFAKEQQIDTLNVVFFGIAQDCWYELPVVKPLPADSVVHGWIAVSEAAYQGAWDGTVIPAGPCHVLSLNTPGTGEYTNGLHAHKKYRWLDAYPLKKKLAGGSIRVYHIPKENQGTQAKNIVKITN